MNHLIVIFSLLFLISIGYLLISFGNFLSDLKFYEKIPYAFGLGVGVIAMQMFIYSRLNISWEAGIIASPWILVFLLRLYNSKFKLMKFKFKASKIAPYQFALFVLIVINLLYTFFEAWLRPLSSWDGWAIWLLKAKMFFIDGFVNPQAYHLLKENYPYVVNLASTFLFSALGEADDRAVLLLFYSFYFFLIASFFFTLKKEIGLKKALFFTFLLSSTQNLIRHGGRFEAGYADLALGFYIFADFTLLLRFIKSRAYQDLILLSIFLGITGLIKEEGLVFVLISQAVLTYYILAKFKNFKLLLVSLLWVIPILDWQLYKILNGLSYSLYANSAFHPERILPIFIEILKEVINIRNWNFLWLSFLFGLLIFAKYGKRRLVYMLIGFQVLSYLAVFLISPYEPSAHVKNVMDRLLLHIAAIAVYSIAAI